MYSNAGTYQAHEWDPHFRPRKRELCPCSSYSGFRSYRLAFAKSKIVLTERNEIKSRSFNIRGIFYKIERPFLCFLK